jgi:tRNA(Ile)-lysidine synthase
LARLADTAQEEERWWQAKIKRLAGKLLVAAEGGVEIGAAELAALPRAVARRLVRYAASHEGCSLEFDAVERVLDLAAGETGRGTLDLAGGRVIRSFDRMRFMTAGSPARPQEVAVTIPGRYLWPEDQTLVCLEIAETESRAGSCARLKLTEGDRSAPLMLRGWRAGDHYHPAGRFRDQKLKEMFQQARVPSWRRGSWPILCKGTEILWTRQFGASAEWAAGQSGPALYVWEEPAEEKHLKA